MRGHFRRGCRKTDQAANFAAEVCHTVARDGYQADLVNATAVGPRLARLKYVPMVTSTRRVEIDSVARSQAGGNRQMSFRFLPDSGSSVTMLPLRTLREARAVVKEMPPLPLTVAGQGTLACTHQCEMVLEWGGRAIRTTVASAATAPAVLSAQACVALGLHPAEYGGGVDLLAAAVGGASDKSTGDVAEAKGHGTAPPC